MSSQLSERHFWDSQWEETLGEYLSAPPRAGLFIERLFGSNITDILELGAGSARDTLYLSRQGYRCAASDVSADTIETLQQRFGGERLSFSVQDAMNLDYPDASFDLVFHNGLIVCFDSDESIVKILQEQHRVARKFMLILAHNTMNRRLVAQFGDLGVSDAVFRIRFFSRDELAGLLERAGIGPGQYRFEKFGGVLDAGFAERPRGVPNPFTSIAPAVVPRAYPLQPWSMTERIACVVEL
ncbi:MAG: class I SAM-dependent methyltransferase [Gammaproteobacteria bacterium]|nr:class I SAM-dependent methyltransferase [Gammaproteobacteria bacterium]